MHRRDFIRSAALLPFLTGGTDNLPAQDAPKNPDLREKAQSLAKRITPITSDERLERQEKARRIMTAASIDALIFEGGVSLNYFTGVSWGRSERLFALIFPRSGDLQYIAPKFEESRAREQVREAQLLTWEEDQNPYDFVHGILRENGLLSGTIGIEETTRYFITENLGRAASSAKLVSGTPVTAGCRSVKSPHEVELMQVANEITAEVFKAAMRSLKEEMKEREFGQLISQLFRECNVNGGALVLFGEASAHPHGLEKEHALKEGDIVLVDGGCSVQGYASDVTRTTVLGKPTEKMKRVWGVVRRAQDAALSAAGPGVPAENVDAAARAIVGMGGYGTGYTYFTHRLGHGIGMEGHEWYYLVRGSGRPLEPGNVFSNEPGIYIIGEFGIRLEDEMLVTETGARLLLPQAESLEKIFT